MQDTNTQEMGWKAVSKTGVVAAGGADAVAAGIEILEQGGNAADAAAATIFALQITDHGACCIGGEVPLLIFDAKKQEVKSLCGQGRAPLSQASIDWYMENGIPGEGDIKMAPVPSVVDLCITTLKQYGTKTYEEVVAPTLALLDAGEEFGIVPFGLEAQRILRLEKKHIIVGQDTDLVSNPLESDMEWVVKFDKEDFIGRGGLVGVSERGFRNRLVGFVMKDSQVPEDGDPVVLGDVPIGRVTSARLSPTLGKGFGMAWVPVDLAREGAEIRIRIGNRSLPAEVSLQPVYDPEGVRLRE